MNKYRDTKKKTVSYSCSDNAVIQAQAQNSSGVLKRNGRYVKELT